MFSGKLYFQRALRWRYVARPFASLSQVAVGFDLFRLPARETSHEVDEACRGGGKSAGAVEAGQVRLEIDMQPLGSRSIF
jgi:hypothetical protein